MVTLLLDASQFEIALSPTERALARRAEPIRIPRERIRKIQLTDDPWTWIRGKRQTGSHVPRVLALGTFGFGTRLEFVAVRRSVAGVVIDIEPGEEFSRCVLSTRHALALVQALQLDIGNSPADVESIVTGAITTINSDEAS